MYANPFRSYTRKHISILVQVQCQQRRIARVEPHGGPRPLDEHRAQAVVVSLQRRPARNRARVEVERGGAHAASR
eukprot:528222-Prymnesium_polylepis.1